MSLTTKTILTIVRHGQTDGNVYQRMEGVTDSPLNETGRTQAICAGKWLKCEKFDIVYTSNLKRAFETASIIMEENLNMTKQKDNFVELDILRERNMGVHEAIPFTEYDKIMEDEGCARYDHEPEKGESTNDVKNRCKEVMKRICSFQLPSNQSLPRILVVSHGFVIAQLFGLIYDETKCPGMPKDEVENLNTAKNDGLKLLSSIPNTGITKIELEIEQNTFKLVSANCSLFKSDQHLI